MNKLKIGQNKQIKKANKIYKNLRVFLKSIVCLMALTNTSTGG